MGSKNYGRIMIMSFNSGPGKKPISSNVVDLRDKNYSYNLPTWQREVLEYDLLNCGYDRSLHLKTFFSIEGVGIDAVGSYSPDNKIQGFAVMKKTESGAYLIGPVIADSNEISIDLISSLQNKLQEGQAVKVLLATVDELGSSEKNLRVDMMKERFGAETLKLGFNLQGTDKYPHNWQKNFGINLIEHSF
eukprot:CAMPEP_0170526960 /NCGR_PEP_ID=MMETSP0209-20121228/12373_1 /TAXON_ID=665100 ORGANISM="Litonotus pictus, Strain P1" /NCGR_SAMPLE_ID=MMETSP0209 /ASSEMBLY_ACC=CAM_ASM_000301 /LENGTH=189 /DNA_ID=CAMNT_0010817111 /DNA_START=32 /DNA_END=601 /DNA_ORIENTATION=-